MSKTKNYCFEDWIVLDLIIKYSIKIFDVAKRRINSIKNEDKK